MVNRLAKGFRKSDVQTVERRIGENDAADGVLRSKRMLLIHGLLLVSWAAARGGSGMIGSSRCEGRSASR